MQGAGDRPCRLRPQQLLQGQYLFRTWTNADAIIDYLVFARNYITQCEERHGEEAVELLLDSCHALMNLGVDRYKRRTQALARQGEAAPAGARGIPAERR
jgi:spore cortex formation protein SpoVR/YcgB (stage V sporulation)